jgi:hypothetical protein
VQLPFSNGVDPSPKKQWSQASRRCGLVGTSS